LSRSRCCALVDMMAQPTIVRQGANTGLYGSKRLCSCFMNGVEIAFPIPNAVPGPNIPLLRGHLYQCLKLMNVCHGFGLAVEDSAVKIILRKLLFRVIKKPIGVLFSFCILFAFVHGEYRCRAKHCGNRLVSRSQPTHAGDTLSLTF
jgi:hypothetical protein